MTTTKQQRKARDENRPNFIPVAALIVSICGLAWQIYQSHMQKRNYEKQFGSIETAIRMLTATVAPQLQKAIDDSLVVSLSSTSKIITTEKLKDVEDDTARLRSIKARLPENAVQHTSEILEKAVVTHSDLVPAWRAAAQMISYRSELRAQPIERPLCTVTQALGGWHISDPFARYHDCTLDLDDSATFDLIRPRLLQPSTSVDAIISPSIILQNGTVKYSGGKMIGVSVIVCVDCSFEFSSPAAIPPPSGRALTQQLLVADLGKVTLSLPGA